MTLLKRVSAHDILAQVGFRSETCVTMYVNDTAQINARIEEVKQIAQSSMKAEAIEALTRQANFLQHCAGREFDGKSIGIFTSSSFTGYVLIPFFVKELSVVASSFHIKPIIKYQQRSNLLRKMKLSYEGIGHRADVEIFLQKWELGKLHAHTSGNNNIVSDLPQIARLAAAGSIEHLFVSETGHLWGNLDDSGRLIKVSARQMNIHDDCVLDDLAELVIENGGRVSVMRGEMMPNKRPALAVTRFLLPNPSILERPGLRLRHPRPEYGYALVS